MIHFGKLELGVLEREHHIKAGNIDPRWRTPRDFPIISIERSRLRIVCEQDFHKHPLRLAPKPKHLRHKNFIIFMSF